MGKGFLEEILDAFLKFDVDDGYNLYDRNNELIDTFASEEDARNFIEENEDFWVDTYDSGITHKK